MITFTELISAGNGTNLSSYSTASISPGANKLILAVIEHANAGGGNDAANSVSGAGLTFDLLGSINYSSVSHRDLDIWRALSASPSSGAITIGFAGAQLHCFWKFIEVDGIDTSGLNGAGAIVQAVVGTIANTATPSVTLAAFADAVNNAAFGAFASAAATTFAPGTGFTEIGADLATTSPTGTVGAEYQIGEDTSVDCTFGAAGNAAGIALEIQAAGGGGGATGQPSMKRWGGVPHVGGRKRFGGGGGGGAWGRSREGLWIPRRRAA